MQLRKVGIKGTTRRITREHEEELASFSEEDEIDEEEQGEMEGEVEEGEEYEYYEEEQSPPKRRRVEDDEEYEAEEEEDSEEQAYFREVPFFSFPSPHFLLLPVTPSPSLFLSSSSPFPPLSPFTAYTILFGLLLPSFSYWSII